MRGAPSTAMMASVPYLRDSQGAAHSASGEVAAASAHPTTALALRYPASDASWRRSPFRHAGETCDGVACQPEGTTLLPEAWDHVVPMSTGRGDDLGGRSWCQVRRRRPVRVGGPVGLVRVG